MRYGILLALLVVTSAASVQASDPTLSVITPRGIQRGAWVQNVSTVLKIGALLGLVVLGLASLGSPAAVSPAAESTASVGLISAFGLAMVPVLWSY
ncbi:MAG: hypothetical protein GY826_37005, partial [Fuerstiella sp.]|nr:hypothetical protein [Fuerstiella sp.]